MAQGGNAWEWEETDFHFSDGSSPAFDERSVRGGNFNNPATYLSSTNRGLGIRPDTENLDTTSFRIASSIEVSGDFNHDGTVNMADYVVWRKNNGSVADYNIWRTNFGLGTSTSGAGSAMSASVPEPSAIAMWVIGAFGFIPCRRRPTSHNHV